MPSKVLMFSLAFGSAVVALVACRAEPGTKVESRPAVAEPAAAAPRGEPQTGLKVIPLTIRGASGTHRFKVEVAATAGQQTRGLMFRRHLDPSAGMIFPFDPPRPASFWMRNTLIPLDMLFIRADGTIARIAVNTVPLSLCGVGVGEPVSAVLELGGGRTVELGIREGDRVTWAASGSR